MRVKCGVLNVRSKKNVTKDSVGSYSYFFLVMDASGMPESGFIYGNNFWVGSHFECRDISNTRPLEVNHEKVLHLQTPYDYPPFSLGFFMVHVGHNSSLQLHTHLPLEWMIQLGLCLPKACSTEEVSALAEEYFNSDYLDVKEVYNLTLKIIGVRELTDDYLWIFKLPKTIALSVIFGIIIFLTILGTVYDGRQQNSQNNILAANNNKSFRITAIITLPERPELVLKQSLETPKRNILAEALQCFSFYSNTKTLMKTKLASDSIACIHGLRFLSMLWVVVEHAVFYQADYIRDAPIAFRLSENFLSQIFSNGTYCVDTYLFLGGFLVSCLYYKSKNHHQEPGKSIKYKTKCKEYVGMFINRFCRLTPLYMVLLLLTDVVYTFYRKTSSLTTSELADVLCDKYWWRNLLYINNLFPRSEMCMSWSWYLSLDTQFFTITTFLLILSSIAFKASVVVLVTLILGSVIATAWKSYSIKYIPTMDEQLTQLDAIYDLPWNRIGPYLVGVITAYILVVKLQNKLVLRKGTLVVLWIIFPLLNLWILFTLYTRQVSVEFSAVYMGISRTLWGVGIAWVLIACCTGNARLLEQFLSFRGFVPLSRLTYSVYLLNPLVANMLYLGSQAPLQSSATGFTLVSFGVALLSFLMAYIFSVTIEFPFASLTKMILQNGTTKNSTSQPKEDS
ncbi:hypothetical protein NQ315_003060 [Exocentrus adspersus]|uniref:Nose resistant-to-fluoxetine protein N-terminal domain-containing protein n=1 Tax=Exocentrus adspersus TaxID=1586481 RepID=A0AAV8W5K1_9CUCU|nr:hypothetical protein NQ315_003060 [Exocentrus adspersus]